MNGITLSVHTADKRIQHKDEFIVLFNFLFGQISFGKKNRMGWISRRRIIHMLALQSSLPLLSFYSLFFSWYYEFCFNLFLFIVDFSRNSIFVTLKAFKFFHIFSFTERTNEQNNGFLLMERAQFKVHDRKHTRYLYFIYIHMLDLETKRKNDAEEK